MMENQIDREAWAWVSAPTLMLSTAIARKNIAWMVAKAQGLGLALRPHFKTHQSLEIGRWFRELGVDRITVSSIEMAEYFAQDGWTDITIAFPANVRAMDALNRLAQNTNLGLLISDPTAIAKLDAGLKYAVNAWIEIDTGDNRSGFACAKPDAILAAQRAIAASKNLKFVGLLGHAGYTYRAQGEAQVDQAHTQDIDGLALAVQQLRQSLGQDFLVSTGDTPGCSLGTDFGPATELRPGNFVFYDVQQAQIGSCDVRQIAVALAAPVVAIYPEKSEAVVHAGGVHLAKDFLKNEDGSNLFGLIAHPQKQGWSAPIEGCFVRSISQEHGIVTLNQDLIDTLQVGDLLAIMPVHSCMTADLMMALYPIDGEEPTQPIRMMKSQYLQHTR